MNLPEGTYLAYYVHHEAWNAGLPGSVAGRSITVYAAQGPWAPWKAPIDENADGSITAPVPLRGVLPELADALEAGAVRSLKGVAALLDSLGAKDETSRESR